MKHLLIALSCCALSQLVGQRSVADIQKAIPEAIPATQVLAAVRLLAGYAETGLPMEDTIKGDREFPDPVMAANVLTFEPGGRLIFKSSVGDRLERYVFARTVRLRGSGGTITWDRQLDTNRFVAPVGKAPPGDVGLKDGGDGQKGVDGQPGNPGYPGRNAPIIYLVVGRIEGGPLEIDLRGRDGSEGGKGQTGGDGGPGRPGASALAMLGICRNPAGAGGNGGPAGNGGRGGEGGRGGNGGTLVLLTPEAALEKLAAMLYVDVHPGKGGPGGTGGEPGLPGERGRPGRAESVCQQGEAGRTGGPGRQGAAGPDGSPGEAGFFAKTALTEQQVRSLQLRLEVK